jgi:septal ring factor EnvC (AmiA/AmiB activator)
MSEEYHTPAPDAFAVLADLLALIADPRSAKQRLRALHDSLAAVSEGEKRLAAKAAEFAEHERKTRGELERRAAALEEQAAALASVRDRREFDLADREERIAELERQWRFVGEDDDVRRGFRAAQFSGLMKARAAYGVAADAVVATPAPPPIRPSFLQTDDDARRDVSGLEFPASTTVTRSM